MIWPSRAQYLTVTHDKLFSLDLSSKTPKELSHMPPIYEMASSLSRLRTGTIRVFYFRRLFFALGTVAVCATFFRVTGPTPACSEVV